jgi:putative flippase GtrA
MTSTAPLVVELRVGHRRVADVEIVVPVYNEEAVLEASVRRLTAYLDDRFPLSWLVTVADNASTDHTWGIACRLATEIPGVQAVHIDGKGRGRALRATWERSTAPVVAYMDVDLSTDLDALLPLVAPLLSGHSDLAIGTRLAPGSRVVRGPKREAISRTYNLLLRTTLRSGFSDAQCGFKAARTEVAHALLPLVEDNGWFFDTELLVLAEHNGLRIHEVPVDWVDDPDSRVDIVGTATADLRGIWRMVRGIAAGRAAAAMPRLRDDGARYRPDLASQLVRFASIGVMSTALFAVIFLLLAGPLGAAPADVIALAVCTVANTAANRRVTFSLRGRAGRARHQLAGLALGVLPLLLTLAALAALAAAGITAVAAQLVAVTAANLAAAAVRFAGLRTVFGGSGKDEQPPQAGPSAPSPTSLPGTRSTGGPALRQLARRLLRYGTVSVISSVVSLAVLGALVATNSLPAVSANLAATVVGTVPSFELNRRWVWGKRGRRSVLAEMGPFLFMSLAGLALSTAAVAVTAGVVTGWATTTRTLAVQGANVAGFGSLWLAQFVLLDRVLFGRPAAEVV